MFFSMFKLSTTILQTIRHQVFPPSCRICKSLVLSGDNQVGCCTTCLSNIYIMPKDTCIHCGVPMPSSFAPGPCGSCLNKVLPQQQTQSLFIYKGAIRKAMLAWKLQGESSSLKWLIHSSSTQLQRIFSDEDILIPVPMPINRMRRSGLHHSSDLCRLLAQVIGAKTDWRLLRRTGQSKRQSSLKGSARQNNFCKAFTLADDYADKLSALQIKGKIWVIDDILTTGATLRHACKAMKRTNQPVFAFSFARTLQN